MNAYLISRFNLMFKISICQKEVLAQIPYFEFQMTKIKVFGRFFVGSQPCK